jgi:hypothetical protein
LYFFLREFKIEVGYLRKNANVSVEVGYAKPGGFDTTPIANYASAVRVVQCMHHRAGGGVYFAIVHGPPPFKTLSILL